MQKGIKIILIISLILNVLLGYILINKTKKSEYNINEYNSRIDSLESVLSSIDNKRDSVRIKIDSVYINLGNVKEEYEKISNDIITNNVSDDYLFFTEYLRKNKARLDSMYNSSSVKRN